ncbi:MAG: GNAT family N-acetyltransferase [Burkholderiaceae bacterium]
MLPTLASPRLVIEHLTPSHAAQLAEFFRRNERHLAPWDPPRPDGIDGVDFWKAECGRAVDEFNGGVVARWVIFRREDRAQAIGRINYTQIARGPFQSCVLGYALDAAFEGQGLMREGLGATIAHAFRAMRLHRIQASYRPDNVRSGRLLEKLGFKREGLASQYLFIDGAWRDHVLTALTNPDFDDEIFGARPTARG